MRGVGRDRKSKRRGGGWGLTVEWGHEGWASVEHPPRYCLLCQAESGFFQEAGLNLSTSTNAVSPSPSPPPLLLPVGAFLFIHRGMETTRKAYSYIVCNW